MKAGVATHMRMRLPTMEVASMMTERMDSDSDESI